ncbi:hypothetical protein HDR60_04770 [bacterium]|nr:hypothetical protein [bacterium]
MFKNLLVVSMLALSSCAFYTNVCDCEDTKENINSLMIETIGKKDVDIKLIELLLKAGADVNATDNYGHSITFSPIYYNRLDILKLLLDNGAELSSFKNSEGKYQLKNYYRSYKYKDMAKFLIENNVDVNEMIDDTSILDIVATNPDYYDREVAQMLINAGAKLNKYKDDKEVKAFLGIE